MNAIQAGRVRFTKIAMFGLLAGLLPACFASTAVAYDAAAARTACTPDAFRLCSAEMPDVPRITACIRRNFRSRSPACRTAISGGGGGVSKGKRVRHYRHR